MTRVSNRRTIAWLCFLGSLLLFSLAATPYSKAADATLISLRLSIVAIASVLSLHTWWRRHDDPQDAPVPRHPDRGENLLTRLRRWYYGE